MVKLTPELICQSIQHLNPVRDRELVLRGLKIPVIENMGATMDQFDTIDLTDNDIRRLDGFPLLKRVKSLLLSNNRIVRIGEKLEESLPSLESIYLTNNQITELHEIDALTSLSHLAFLSFLGNSVTNKPHYRAYVIHKIPNIRVLDFVRVKQKERDHSRKLFKSKSGKELQKEISRSKVAAASIVNNTFIPGAGMPIKKSVMTKGLTPEEQASIRDAIRKARSMEEVERLSKILKSGQIPEGGLKRKLTEEFESY